VSFFVVLYMSVLASVSISMAIYSTYSIPSSSYENIKPHFIAKKSVDLRLADLKA
jgi:hypothetical protein